MKKNKVLLIYPPISHNYAPHPLDIPVPHIGIAYIGALLEKEGYDVTIVDCPAEELDLKGLFERIESVYYEVVGISSYYYNNSNVIRIVKKLEGKCKFLFLGGMLPTLSPEKVLKSIKGVDCCVIGEGEKTVLELVEALECGVDWTTINGLAYVGNNKEVIVTAKRNLIADLDELPFPIRVKPKREFYTPVLASRGCYGNCNFCSIESYFDTCEGMKVRIRNPLYVVNEIEELVQQGHTHIKFNDENMNFSSLNGKKWFDLFYSEIKKRNIKAKYIVDMRVNEVIKGEEEIKKFKEIGLEFIFIGVESFIQRHLDFFNKHVKVDQNIKAMKVLDEMKVNYRIGLLLFNPISTLEEIETSLRMLEEIYYLRKENMMKPISLFQPVIAVSGTPIYDYVVENGLYENNGRGYRFFDREVEDYYEFVKKWAKYVEKLYEYHFMNTKQDIVQTLFQRLYQIDLKFMMEALKLIKYGKDKKSVELNTLFGVSKAELDDLAKEINDIYG